MLVGGPVAIAWSISVLVHPPLRVIAALWAAVALVFEFVCFTPLQKSWRLRAAKIQEVFDCDVLDLPWNAIKAGHRPAPEEVHENAEKYIRHDDGSFPLENWYPPAVGELPLGLARIVCQRSNCRWDANQRFRYAHWIGGSAIAIFAAILLSGYALGATLPSSFLTIAPALPLVVVGIRHLTEQREAASRLATLQQDLDDLWSQALLGQSEDSLAQSARQVQDEIFQNRKASTPVFDFVYALLQRHSEVQMVRSAQDLIQDARQANRRD